MTCKATRRGIAGLVVLAWLGSACEPPDRAEAFLRPVVMPEHPLELGNPQDETIEWPVWGGAFAIADVSIRAAFESVGRAGLVIAGPGPVDERVAVEILALADAPGAWTLRETVGGELVQEQSVAVPNDRVISLSKSELRVGSKLALALTQPLGLDGAEAGIDVILEPGAALRIDELSLTAPLPTHPELGPPLRELATARGLDVGTGFDIWPPLHDLELESLLAEQFARLSPTDFYWSTTRGEDQEFFFIPADLAVNYALVHDQAITGNFLIWDYALPSWVHELDTPALVAAFDEHITTTIDRYEDRIDTWVVVNEAIWGAAETGDEPEYARTIWYDALGPDYIERAFVVARAADPDATLLYNETGAEALGDKSDFMLAMLEDLLERGVPIDGVGLQFHVHAASPPASASVRANMERIAALGLSVHVTELDVSLEGLDTTAPEQLELQAQIYADVLEACLAVPACESWTVFGFGDRYSWDELGDAAPLLFDLGWAPKPAFFAVQDALR